MIIEMAGSKFGRYTVLHKTITKNGMMHWMCLCECGSVKEVCGNALRTGGTKSCGCLAKENASQIHKYAKPRPPSRNKEKLYHVWKKMRSRCRGDEEHTKKYYSSRGITVCPAWDDYSTFKEWALSNGYSPDLTIDRINNDLGYSPENCRWVTMFEQASNKRNNRWIEACGMRKTLAQWARLLDIPPPMLFRKLDKNGIHYIVTRLAELPETASHGAVF